MTERNSYDVFVSYSSRDHEWASEFADALKTAGVKVWIGVSELSLGDRWQEEMLDALRGSRFFVVILSSHSTVSPWVYFELGAAVADHKVIVPVVGDKYDLGRIPVVLRQYQFLIESSPEEAGRRVAEVVESQAGHEA